MTAAIVLSADQSDLIRRLIEFAENNDFFESEFDDEEERSYFAYSRVIANELERKLYLYEETNDVASGPAEQVATNSSITMVDGRPWWDLSNVRPLSPEQLHQQLQEIRDRLRTLMSHSDSLQVRQIILEAIYLLRSTDPHISIGNSERSS
ncbi:MAG: hypothetical protein L0387_05520 [Acidobacteria bacterium]|nr:hypothetical protein [Acidobacteriota bacterium]MCI0621121.1 hypothetical protein [Acidobacteriota bacterium]MCI0723886.1 hypothetical protein [Acidobacteriota bacterium]